VCILWCFCTGSRSLFSFKTHTRTEPYKPVKTQEAIQLAKLPDAQLLDKGHMRPIERDDWPSPPATAAAFPELCMLSVLLIICAVSYNAVKFVMHQSTTSFMKNISDNALTLLLDDMKGIRYPTISNAALLGHLSFCESVITFVDFSSVKRFRCTINIIYVHFSTSFVSLFLDLSGILCVLLCMLHVVVFVGSHNSTYCLAVLLLNFFHCFMPSQQPEAIIVLLCLSWWCPVVCRQVPCQRRRYKMTKHSLYLSSYHYF